LSKQVSLVLHPVTAEHRSMTRRAWSAAALTVVLWASAFAAIRAALDGFTALQLSVTRLALASLALAVIAPFAGIQTPRGRDIPRLLACGATGMTAYQLLLNSGERHVTAGTASLLVSTGPIFVAVLAAATLNERLNPLGLIVGFLGAVIIAAGQGGGIALSSSALVVLAAAVCQAVFFVIQKPLLARYTPFTVTAYAMWSGTLLILPVAHSVPRASAGPWLAVLLLALGSSALGFFAWAYANARLPVARVSASLYAVPVVAIAVAFAWLGELPTATSLGGGAVCLLGVAITSGRLQLGRCFSKDSPGLTPAKPSGSATTR
jgi:drug/metabolite transporter (DMT)-like permease